MPRLIDADAFAEELLGYIYERGQESGSYEDKIEIGAMTYRDLAYENGYDYALEEFWHNLEERPTVDAISIEWLENFMNKLPRDNSTDGMSWTSLERWGIKMAISAWERENAKID
jgi:hypothetical protein